MKAFFSKKLICSFLLLTLLMAGTASAQYLRVNGKQIVDKDGKEVILRGMGLGGWMLQEGYMLETGSFANTQHDIKAKITDMIGAAGTAEFYDAWLANHCTERDIDSLAKWGFNSIRLPMHYNLYTLPIQEEPVAGQNTWLDKGFTMTDNLLQWCAKNKMYLILDLHATPGGQGNDAAISDYDNTKPSLWESDANKQKTIALWRKLAERYANEPWIGGYDLINEPNWNFTPGANKNGCQETTNVPLRQLYIAITSAIREVDKNHIIYIEGNCWANNYAGLLPPWDNNMVASFHKYWNNNDQGSVQFINDIRNQHNLPIWLGESGENSNTWFTNAISLMESNKIGWAWWPEKKVSSIVGPMTVKKNDGYNDLLNYWKNGGTKPSQATAKASLMQLAENLKIENNIQHPDVIDAMFRQVGSKTAKPFAANKVPGVIAITDFDLGRNGVAYSDADTANYQVTTGSYAAWNSGFAYRNDGVDIEATQDTDTNSNGYNVGWTQDNEWLQYTITVESDGAYDIGLRYATAIATSRVKLKLDKSFITPSTVLASTGGYQAWATKTFSNVVLYKGTHTLRLLVEKGGANLGFLKFELKKKVDEVPFTAVFAETAPSGQIVYISVNKLTDVATVSGTTGFSALVNGAGSGITAVQVDETNAALLRVTIDQPIADNSTISISYQGDAVKATDGTLLEDFTSLAVQNNLPLHFTVPVKIEAESYFVNQGLESEVTTDTGGGLNMGHTSTGDYLDYRLRVPLESIYPIEVRVACNAQAGKIEIQQLSNTNELLASTTIDVPVTGGWQNWQTVKGKITLKQGDGKLRLKIVQPEFNINWINILKDIVTGVDKKKQKALNVYPNPADKRLFLELPDNAFTPHSTLSIKNVTGQPLKLIRNLTPEKSQDIFVGDLASGLYIIQLDTDQEIWTSKFIVK
jgi:aryl-phospho-beta-D-glucosidase BglC (GH1 family)